MALDTVKMIDPATGEEASYNVEGYEELLGHGYTLAPGEPDPTTMLSRAIRGASSVAEYFADDPAKASALAGGTAASMLPIVTGAMASGAALPALGALGLIGGVGALGYAGHRGLEHLMGGREFSPSDVYEHGKEELLGSFIGAPAVSGAARFLGDVGNLAGQAYTGVSSLLSGVPIHVAQRLYENPQIAKMIGGGAEFLSDVKKGKLLQHLADAPNVAQEAAEKLTARIRDYKKAATDQWESGMRRVRNRVATNVPMNPKARAAMEKDIRKLVSRYYTYDKKGNLVPNPKADIDVAQLNEIKKFLNPIIARGKFPNREDMIAHKTKIDTRLNWKSMDDPFKSDTRAHALLKQIRGKLNEGLRKDIPGYGAVNDSYHEKMKVFERFGDVLSGTDTEKNKQVMLRFATGGKVGSQEPLYQVIEQVGGRELLDELTALAYMTSNLAEGSPMSVARKARLGAGTVGLLPHWSDPFLPEEVLAAAALGDPLVQRSMLPAVGKAAQMTRIPEAIADIPQMTPIMSELTGEPISESGFLAGKPEASVAGGLGALTRMYDEYEPEWKRRALNMLSRGARRRDEEDEEVEFPEEARFPGVM